MSKNALHKITPQRLVKNDLRGFPVRLEKFEAHFAQGEGCWEWTGTLNSTGYGSYGKRLAHRVAYEVYVGPIPDGMHVCHSCDNRRCANPAHLWLGSASENMRDCKAKGRMSMPPRFVGAGHPQSKLTDEKIISIRQEIDGGAQKRPTARKYQIDRATLQSIIERRTWRHV